jgi:hypothetical protein
MPAIYGIGNWEGNLMSLTSCTIRFANKSDKTVYVTSMLANALRLKKKKPVTIRFGGKTGQYAVKLIKGAGKQLVLPASARTTLLFPQPCTCQIMCNDDNQIRLGPLVGILTTGSGQGNLFGTRTSLIRSLLRVGSGMAVPFAFRPRDIDWVNERVHGFVLSQGGRFVRKTVPLPDVVYNRLPSRKAEKLQSMELFKERFIRRRIPIFNWSFFEKWDVYRLLAGDPAAKYVPESYFNPSGARIREMLQKHSFVYLKPTGGSLGNGIFRLTWHPRKGYFCRYRQGGRNLLLRFDRFSHLLARLNRGNRMRNYVIQQGIRLIELDRCPIDFRFHMNKNGNNEWVAAGIGAKRAGRGSVTTHVRSGGKLMTPEAALTRIYGSQAKAEEMLNKAKQVAIQLAEAIERNYPHRLGELGFDIGIDQRDNIWMFEANAKPGRSIFKHPALKAQGVATLRHIFEYSAYLSRFRAGRESG